MIETLRPTYPVPAAPTPVRRVRDELFRLITLALGRVLLPAAWITSGRDARARAAEWALQLRFPRESLAGLTTDMGIALRRARVSAFWEHHLLLGVTSGHRTVDEQNRMVAEDVARLRSTLGARARVLPAEQSQHIAGLAADLRPREAALWLEQHGHRFDLYRTYANEWWHFEYLPQNHGVAPPLLAHPGAGRLGEHRTAATRHHLRAGRRPSVVHAGSGRTDHRIPDADRP